MSAHMVDNEHIDAMLTAGLTLPYAPLRWWHDIEPRTWENRRELTFETADRVGAMLLAENRASVNHLYREDELEQIYTFSRLPSYQHARHALIALKAISGYEYQACEHDGWLTSEARAFCIALKDRLIRCLPGYDNAAGWAITRRDIFRRPQ